MNDEPSADLAADRAWNLVLMPDNRGFGPGVNAGVARARELGCQSFLLLNPDVEASADVIEALRIASRARADGADLPADRRP